MKSKLDYIESRLEALIENRFTWLPWQNLQPRLARQIVEALRSNVFLEIEENQVLPNLIIFSMNPDNLSAWEANQDWLTWLAQAIQDCIIEAGASIVAPPIIRLQSDPFLTQDELDIRAGFPTKDLGSTAAMTAFKMFSEAQSASKVQDTYLILHNGEIFLLNQSVVNIGRRPENQLILEDLRVSRDHAQIRKIQGHYVLFDLNSTGGTFVNSKRITQYTLRTGDVISFAGVTVIFAEDITDHNSRTSTSPLQQ